MTSADLNSILLRVPRKIDLESPKLGDQALVRVTVVHCVGLYPDAFSRPEVPMTVVEQSTVPLLETDVVFAASAELVARRAVL